MRWCRRRSLRRRRRRQRRRRETPRRYRGRQGTEGRRAEDGRMGEAAEVEEAAGRLLNRASRAGVGHGTARTEGMGTAACAGSGRIEGGGTARGGVSSSWCRGRAVGILLGVLLHPPTDTHTGTANTWHEQQVQQPVHSNQLYECTSRPLTRETHLIATSPRGQSAISQHNARATPRHHQPTSTDPQPNQPEQRGCTLPLHLPQHPSPPTQSHATCGLCVRSPPARVASVPDTLPSR